MGLVKLTFDGANNTAKMDAYVNAYLTSYQNGIINGLGNSLTYSIANGKITFSSGVVSIYGRRVYVEDGTSIDITLDSIKKGYVLMNINTETNEVSMSISEVTSGSIPITQTNLLQEDGLYQFVMCAYNKSTSSLSADTDFQRDYVKTTKQELTALQTTIENNFKYRYIRRFSSVGGVQKFDITSIDISNSLIIIPINYLVTLSLPATMLNSLGSVKSIQYTYNGSTYSLICEKGSDGYLYFTPGSLAHNIQCIYIFY